MFVTSLARCCRARGSFAMRFRRSAAWRMENYREQVRVVLLKNEELRGNTLKAAEKSWLKGETRGWVHCPTFSSVCPPVRVAKSTADWHEIQNPRPEVEPSVSNVAHNGGRKKLWNCPSSTWVKRLVCQTRFIIENSVEIRGEKEYNSVPIRF